MTSLLQRQIRLAYVRRRVRLDGRNVLRHAAMCGTAQVTRLRLVCLDHVVAIGYHDAVNRFRWTKTKTTE